MLKKIYNYLDKNLEFLFLCLFGAVCLLAVMIQVVTRVLSISLPWTEEVSRYSFIWVTFWGMGYAIKQNNNIRFELLLNLFKGKGKIAVEILIDVIVLALFGVMFYFSILFVRDSVGRLAPALNISKNIVNISAPICFGVCVLREVQQIVGHIKALGKKEA